MFKKGKFSIDDALDGLDMNYSNYMPSIDALEFFSIIKVFMGEDFEIANCKFHYFIVDMLYGNVKPEDFPYSADVIAELPINPSRIGIIASRGSAKSTITTTFYPIVCAIKGETPLIKNISHMLILSDSQQGGARDQAKLLAGEFEKSTFAKEFFEKMRFTESEVELVRKGVGPVEKRHILIKFKGAQFLPTEAKLYGEHEDITMGAVVVGDRVYGPDGKLATVTDKSELFRKQGYRLSLQDGRTIDVSEDHINSILYKSQRGGKYVYDEMDIVTDDMLELDRYYTSTHKRTGKVYNAPRIWIKNTEPVEYTEKEFVVDPYTVGVILGDGHVRKDCGSVTVTAHPDDMKEHMNEIPHKHTIGDGKGNTKSMYINGIAKEMVRLGMNVSSCNKSIPEEYMRGSVEQRLHLLQGLIDTDGTIAKGKRGARYMTTSKRLAEDVAELVRSLGGRARVGISNRASGDVMMIQGNETKRNHDVYRVYIKLNMQVARLSRKVSKIVQDLDVGKVGVTSIEPIGEIEGYCIAIDNEERQYLTDGYVRTHNTGGIRSGSRNPVTRDRYAIIIGDDVIKNEAESYSETIMKNVRTALESDALNAMRGKNTQLVLINTPFHKRDPIYMSLESGVFTPLVAPICKEIYDGMPEDEFEPLWGDMHDYSSVMQRYINATAGSSTRSFNQELMLRVSAEEDRMISEEMLENQWYDRKMLMDTLGGYNLYITTDFTTTSETKSDFSAMVVWAVGSNKDMFILDLCVKKQGLQEQYNELFRMVNYWSRGGRYIEVGVEIDGQQKAHIFTLKEMMQKRNEYFSFARQKGAPVTREGILSKGSGVNKHERFKYMVPHFQNKKIWFPRELRDTPDMKEAMKQLKYTTYTGFAGHDDFCFTGDTPIMMSDGTHKRIDTIVDGDEVMTFGTDRLTTRSYSTIMTGEKDVSEYTLSDGTVVQMTSNHPILTSEGWKPAGELTSEDSIIRINICNKSSMTERDGQEKSQGTTNVQQSTKKVKESGCISMYGNVLMGLSLKVWTYITKTTTKIITR